jgi:hypothetical protein
VFHIDQQTEPNHKLVLIAGRFLHIFEWVVNNNVPFHLSIHTNTNNNHLSGIYWLQIEPIDTDEITLVPNGPILVNFDITMVNTMLVPKGPL